MVYVLHQVLLFQAVHFLQFNIIVLLQSVFALLKQSVGCLLHIVNVKNEELQHKFKRFY